MDRDDLTTPEGKLFVSQLDRLVQELDQKRQAVTSWYGALYGLGFEFSIDGLRSIVRRFSNRRRRIGKTAWINRGAESYDPLPGISCDELHPWFLYWEAFWVTANGPKLHEGIKVLDAGGTASLFSYYVASRGPEIHSVDLNERLVIAGKRTAHAMHWNLHSLCMDVVDLSFCNACFDHAYSICVLEHLDADMRQRALLEIARVLKPGGILSLTFDYGAPGVYLVGQGFNYEPNNLIRTPDDVHRHFLSCELFEPIGHHHFVDNGKTYLTWPDDPSKKYTFGSVFLRRI